MRRRRFAAILVFSVMALAACGGSSSTDDSTFADPADPLPEEPATAAEVGGDEPRRPYTGSPQDRVEDAMMEARVLLALADDAQLGYYPFSVEVREGHAFVGGEVASAAHHARVEQVVRGVSGIRGVTNEVAAPQAVAADQPAVEDEGAPDDVAPEESSASAVYHTVQSGESLWTIARQHGTSVEAIQRLNNMSAASLRPGQRLRVR